jgi:hypothetical protein
MQTKSQIPLPVIIAAIVLIAITVPFVYASLAAGDSHRFAGFLINPVDGLSYLAKMYQGGEGSWRYQMAFTAEPGEGVFIHLFYLALGHIARAASLPLLGLYHATRLILTLILLGMLWKIYGTVLSSVRHQRLAFSLAALGSGLGWLGIPFGLFTSDMWVAETYPFLATYTNPHFVFSLILVLGLILPASGKFSVRRFLKLLLAAFVLSLVSPFGVIVVLVILAGQVLLKALVQRAWPSAELFKDQALSVAAILVGSAPFLLYYYWITKTHAVIIAWNAQNLTPSPEWWDLLLSLSPALLLAGLGAWWLIKKHGPGWVDQQIFPFLVWAGLGLVLIYLPFGLQRRFMLGLYIPLAGLSALGLEYISTERKPYRFWASLLFVLVIPTNLVVVLAGVHGISTRDEKLFITRAEDQALAWIEENTREDDLILASPDMGAIIPAYTGRRVIYGHPFETINAREAEQGVLSFFESQHSRSQADEFLVDQDVEYIFYGPREQHLGNLKIGPNWAPVYSHDSLILYQVGE